MVLRLFVLAFLALTVPAGAMSIVQLPATQPVIGGEGEADEAFISWLSTEIGDDGYHWLLVDPIDSCRCHVDSRWRQNSGGPALVDGEPEAGSGLAPISQAKSRDCLEWLAGDDDEGHWRASVHDACECDGELTSYPVDDRVLRTTSTWDRADDGPVLPFWWEPGTLIGHPWHHEDWYPRGCGPSGGSGGGIASPGGVSGGGGFSAGGIASLGPLHSAGLRGFIGGLSGGGGSFVGGSGGGGSFVGGSGTPTVRLVDLDDPSVQTPTPTPLPAAGFLFSTVLAALGIFGWVRRRYVAP